MPDETDHQAAQRLVIIAQDIERRFVNGKIEAPLGLPNSIAAIRLILDRLDGGDRRSEAKDHGFGHGDECYWCGFNPDKEPERPCDERLRKRPSKDDTACVLAPTCTDENAGEYPLCPAHLSALLDIAKREQRSAEATDETCEHGYYTLEALLTACEIAKERERERWADEQLALLDENAHLAAFLRVALIEFRDELDCLDRINKTVGGWGQRRERATDRVREATALVVHYARESKRFHQDALGSFAMNDIAKKLADAIAQLDEAEGT